MTEIKRPWVAAIGLDDAQVASINPMCGNLRVARTLSDYTQLYSWTETDILVAADLYLSEILQDVHVLSLGSVQYGGTNKLIAGQHQFDGIVQSNSANKERHLHVSEACPQVYYTLAGRLSTDLARAEGPHPTFHAADHLEHHQQALVATWSRHSVALRLQVVESDWPGRPVLPGVDPIVLLLPEAASLTEWFRAFLTDIHENDPERVPRLPPRISVPSDWYTPEENALAEIVAEIDRKVERLENERQRIESQRTVEAEQADAGIKRAIWSDGHELVEAVAEILSDLGFTVRNMDADIRDGERKREDLRLTLESRSDWEAIVEVKGYTKGTRTSDAGRIRVHREFYIKEKGRIPDLTIWLANEYRREDPSSRRATRADVGQDAANIGAVHVLSTDLYKQWALVKRGKLDAGDVIQRLMNAEPGLWQPSPLPSSV